MKVCVVPVQQGCAHCVTLSAMTVMMLKKVLPGMVQSLSKLVINNSAV